MRLASLCCLLACLLGPRLSAGDAQSVPIGIDGDNPPQELGLNFIYKTYPWQEPSEGAFPWLGLKDKDDPFLKKLKELKKAGYKIAITFTNVHMDKKHLPEYLKGRRFNDPKLLHRWAVYLESFTARYGGEIDFINIGNELNNYFGKQRQEWPDYVEYLKLSSQTIKRSRPQIKVGIILGNGDLQPYWRDAGPFCDYLALTYYTPCSTFSKSPTQQALDPRNPLYFANRLDEALRLCGNKKLLIEEIGCATHPGVDSSPELQAEFIRKVFAWLRGKEHKVLAMSWLSLKDWHYEGTRTALKGYLDDALLKHEPFMRYLTSLGLFYEDGKEKPGYKAFKDELLRYRAGN